MELHTEAMEAVNVAQQTANQNTHGVALALSATQAAQGTADQALADSAAAQGTAETALENAAMAQQTANQNTHGVVIALDAAKQAQSDVDAVAEALDAFKRAL